MPRNARAATANWELNKLNDIHTRPVATRAPEARPQRLPAPRPDADAFRPGGPGRGGRRPAAMLSGEPNGYAHEQAMAALAQRAKRGAVDTDGCRQAVFRPGGCGAPPSPRGLGLDAGSGRSALVELRRGKVNAGLERARAQTEEESQLLIEGAQE